jgi:hypothetical protein
MIVGFDHDEEYRTTRPFRMLSSLLFRLSLADLPSQREDTT